MEYRVGIDLGGTNVAVGVVDENKQIIARASIKTRPERMLDDVIYDIGCCVKEAVKKGGNYPAGLRFGWYRLARLLPRRRGLGCLCQ